MSLNSMRHIVLRALAILLLYPAGKLFGQPSQQVPDAAMADLEEASSAVLLGDASNLFEPPLDFIGPLPDPYRHFLPGAPLRIPPDPYFYLPGQQLFYYQSPPKRTIPFWLPTLIYLAFAPLCLGLLWKPLRRRRCYHGLLVLLIWAIGAALASSAGPVFNRAMAGRPVFQVLFDQGRFFLPASVAILALLALALRNFMCATMALLIGAGCASVGLPLLWAVRFQPEAEAYRLAGDSCRVRLAVDSRGQEAIISRGPDGVFDTTAAFPITFNSPKYATETEGPDTLDWDRLKNLQYDPNRNGPLYGDLIVKVERKEQELP